MPIDPALTAAFQLQPRAFMKNHVMAVIGLQVSETLRDDANKEVKRPTFPARPSAPVPGVADTEGRAGRNYALKQPIILAGGIERITQIKGHQIGTPLNALRISPLNSGAPPAGMFSIYYLPYANNLAYTMQLDSAPTSPRFFCTDAINGCTFQVAGTMDKPVVTHANVQGMDLSQNEKAQFLEFFLEPACEGATRRANSVIAARLQRFSPSTGASVNPASVVTYGSAATTAYSGVNRVVGRSTGVETFTRIVRGTAVKYEVNTTISAMDGSPMDATGGEVAVIGCNPSGNAWRFFWSMYVPAKVTSLYYEVGAGASRKFVDSVSSYDLVPLVSGRFLWPDWNAGTPYSIRNGHLGM